MTDEKRLPWKSFEAKIGLSFFTKSTREIIVPVERDGVFYVIPEPEARRLHALDSEVVKLNERVKKFEEGCKCLFSALNGSEITLKERNGIVLSKEIDLLRKSILFEAIDLLREAMGEDR